MFCLLGQQQQQQQQQQMQGAKGREIIWAGDLCWHDNSNPGTFVAEDFSLTCFVARSSLKASLTWPTVSFKLARLRLTFQPHVGLGRI